MVTTSSANYLVRQTDHRSLIQPPGSKGFPRAVLPSVLEDALDRFVFCVPLDPFLVVVECYLVSFYPQLPQHQNDQGIESSSQLN